MSKFKLIQTEDGKVSSVIAVMGDLEIQVAEFDPAVDLEEALRRTSINKKDLAGYEPPPMADSVKPSSANNSKARELMLSKALKILPEYDPKLKCNFGKHKGQDSSTIPIAYKKWIVDEVMKGFFELNSFITFCFVLNCFHDLKITSDKLLA